MNPVGYRPNQSTSYESTSPSNSSAPKIILSGFCFFKMLYLANKHSVEVGGWGVAEDPKAPMEIGDIKVIKQESSSGHIDFDDEGIVEYMEDMADKDYEFDQFMRIWVHTHPSNSVTPSTVDRETFRRLGSTLPWIVMLIIGKEGAISAELGTNIAGNFFITKIDVEVCWEFDTWQEWDKEFDLMVEKFRLVQKSGKTYAVPEEGRPSSLKPGQTVAERLDELGDGWDWKDGKFLYTVSKKDHRSDPTKEPSSSGTYGKAKRKRKRGKKRKGAERPSKAASGGADVDLCTYRSQEELQALGHVLEDGGSTHDWDNLNEDDWKALHDSER